MALVRRLMEKLRKGTREDGAAPASVVPLRPSDRRETRRYPANHHAVVCIEGQETTRQEGRVVDFSERGLRLAIRASVRAGDVGRAYIHFNGCVLRREFEVVRVDGDTLAARLRPAREALEQTLTYLQLLNWQASQLGVA